MTYYAYLLRCRGGELYAGITTDVVRRFAEHASGGLKAAKYTRVHPPVRMEAIWEFPDRVSASAFEYRVKRLSHEQKERLVVDSSAARPLLAAALARAESPRVLLLGNSLTTACDLPGRLADAIAGQVVVHARGGARLSEHLNPETQLGARTQAALAAGGFTHVVLQERSDAPVRTRAAYLRAVAVLCAQVEDAGAVPVVYATWAYAPSCAKLAGLSLDHAGMHAALQSAFGEAAAATGARLANVGAAFFESDCLAELYAPDGVHPSAAGAALAVEALAGAVLSDASR